MPVQKRQKGPARWAIVLGSAVAAVGFFGIVAAAPFPGQTTNAPPTYQSPAVVSQYQYQGNNGGGFGGGYNQGGYSQPSPSFVSGGS